MGFVGTILIGLLAGMAASWLMKTKNKWYVDLLIGLAGSALAGWIVARLTGVTYDEFGLFPLLASIGGAVLVILIYRWFKSRK